MDGAVATGRDRGALNPRSKICQPPKYPSPPVRTPPWLCRSEGTHFP